MPKSLLPPKWKRDRELRRLRRQFADSIGLVTAPVTRIWWDRVRATRIRVTEGARAASPRVAVFLVFQPNGIARSVLDTLDAVLDAGYAPLVIVNGAVSPGDMEDLRRRAWRVLVRPNVGYDFGGYRDGVWYLRENDIPVEALLVMNDTLWLPAGDAGFTLRRLETLGVPYAALSNFVYRPGRKRSDALSGRTYASSFGFRVDAAVWRSDAFQEFWRRFPLHTAKRKVVEHGEVGFSHAMTRAGFAPVAILDQARVIEEQAEAPPDVQEAWLAMLPVLGGALRKDHERVRAQIEEGTAPPGAAAEFLAAALPRLNPWDSMVVRGLVTGQIDFVKKANLKDAGNARRFLQALDTADYRLNATVRGEIEAIARG